MEKKELKIIGVTKTAFQSGAHALVLAEAEGERILPVVISASEAYPIAMSLEHINCPRPLTVDLFVAMTHGFGVKLVETFIYKFEDGVFYAELTFSDGERTMKIDGRTSDAAAIILRTPAPLYTTEQVLSQAGFIPEKIGFDDVGKKTEGPKGQKGQTQPQPEKYAIEELERELRKLTAEERYEEAARIAAILERKRRERDAKGQAEETEEKE